MDDNLRHKVVSGVIWQYVQRLGSQAIQFIVSIVLTRLLVPDDFGMIALLGVFIAVSNIFIDSGFGNALIQKRNIDDVDCNSVFYLNIGVSVAIYSIVFLCAPLVADFYAMPALKNVLRVLSIQIILMAFGCVQSSLLVRELKFRYNFYIAITGCFFSAIVGICMAYNGYGVWSLVCSQLMSQFAHSVGLWFFVGWRPKWIFSYGRIKELFNYSSKILGGQIISVLYNNVYNLVIGKRYSVVDLGFYNRGQLLPNTAIDTASNSINAALFPALSKVQDDKLHHKALIRKAERVVASIIFILASMLCVLAPNIIGLLFGSKWAFSVPFMQIVSVTLSFSPISVLNQTIQTSIGRSDLYLKTMFISKVVAIFLIYLGSLINLYAMVVAGAIASLLTFLITRVYNKKLIGYSFKEQLEDICPPIFLAIIAGGIVFLIRLIGLNDFMTLILGGMVGAASYISMAYIFKVSSVTYILNQAFSKIKRPL